MSQSITQPSEPSALQKAIIAAEERVEYISLDADRGVGLRMGGLDSVVGIPRELWFKIIEEQRLEADIESFAAFVRNELVEVQAWCDRLIDGPVDEEEIVIPLTPQMLRDWTDRMMERIG